MADRENKGSSSGRWRMKYRKSRRRSNSLGDRDSRKFRRADRMPMGDDWAGSVLSNHDVVGRFEA